MRSSGLPANSSPLLVVDASVVINLNATGRARDIIAVLPYRVVVTSVVLAELTAGAIRGHEDAKKLQLLLDGGDIDLVELSSLASEIYASLVGGAAIDTLDDGEASTIAFASVTGAIAAIDERKARRICASRFSGLQIVWTIDLLLDEAITVGLGREEQADAVFNALQLARMRVPHEYLDKILKLIGRERAAQCRSLPKTSLGF